ncbi:hypothetical protein ADIARSV_1280 [Arcticibacter svalbardensis MN12-7]|uniref:Uncharacterized protein n=1 Tax=Arcticibacter svalbardensis MN12-7 TaxID=1150600 RepID=R9H2W9_9SPHI|nr:hypothetical protein ADIARSV_1280 [Arcticibacter svalbardensis MN12-7]
MLKVFYAEALYQLSKNPFSSGFDNCSTDSNNRFPALL